MKGRTLTRSGGVLAVVVALLVTARTGFAADGWFQDYVNLSLAPTGNSGYYWIGLDPSLGTGFDNLNLRTVPNLRITGADMRYWNEAQDRTGGAFYWKIDNGSFTSATLDSVRPQRQ